jgi:succinate dehydrogenase / fumarate reductase, cytochrome b subunit
MVPARCPQHVDEQFSTGTERQVMFASVRWELLWTSVGLKAVMAVSGLAMSGWVFLHMGGNLLVFAGPEVLDGYGAMLQGSPLVWLMRAGLLAAIVAHLGAAYVLTRRSRAARPERYRRPLARERSTLASRTMRTGGALVLLFLVYHLLHIYGPLHPSYVSGRVHHNLVAGLSHPLVAAVYAAATLVFGLHLHHGSASLFRSLGHARLFERGVRGASLTFSVVVTLGFLAPCVAALAGWI